MDDVNWIAIYGAVVATIVALVQIIDVGYRWRVRRPRIRVTSGWTKSTHAPEKTFVGVTAANVGERPVMLNAFIVRLPDGRQIHFQDLESYPQLPAEIPSQQTCEVTIEHEV